MTDDSLPKRGLSLEIIRADGFWSLIPKDARHMVGFNTSNSSGIANPLAHPAKGGMAARHPAANQPSSPSRDNHPRRLVEVKGCGPHVSGCDEATALVPYAWPRSLAHSIWVGKRVPGGRHGVMGPLMIWTTAWTARRGPRQLALRKSRDIGVREECLDALQCGSNTSSFSTPIKGKFR
jgi:hypothetical protein